MQYSPSHTAQILARDYPSALRVLALLGGRDDPTRARLVGGVVRDLLLSIRAKDVDIATTLLPDQVMGILVKEGISMVPSGIEYGTVMAIIDAAPIEITTLRQDTHCDGRHAAVAFSTDWAEDALRRDFTFNALSLSYHGELFDYTNGIADLEARHVVFIGDPAARIQEDHLRILRYLRFLSRFYGGAMSVPSFAGCVAHRQLLSRLSRERIQQEMLQCFREPSLMEVLSLPGVAEILAEIMPSPPDWPLALATLQRVIQQERRLQQVVHPLLRIAALFPDATQIDAIVTGWRLSKKAAAQLSLLAAPHIGAVDEAAVKCWMVRHGAEVARLKLSLESARQGAHQGLPLCDPSGGGLLWALISEWPVPSFPLTGADLAAIGIPPGKAMGTALSRARCHWEKRGYHLTRKELRDWLLSDKA